MDLFGRSGETYCTQLWDRSFSSASTGTLAATALMPLRFRLIFRAKFLTCPGGVPGDNWTITLTVPSAFTGKLSRSGAACDPYLPLPDAPNAAVANKSSIVAIRCKRQNWPAAPFVLFCGFIGFSFLLPAKFCELPGECSLSCAPRHSCSARVIAKNMLRNPKRLRDRKRVV